MNKETIPVTILTGFLGSGKTTLLNRILTERHGRRIAVIENEFGEAGVDNELLITGQEQIVEMNNGCICCTVRGDLVRILGDLADKRASGELAFERVIIETTGLADPGPVAQTFFVDDKVQENYLLDAVITLVDAKHAPTQLDQHHEAQEQVGFADRILVSKTDLTSAEQTQALLTRLKNINPRASIATAHFGATDLKQILDIRGFNLDDILEIEPGFLEEDHHEHDDAIASFVFRERRPFVQEKLEAFLGGMVQTHGPDMLRYKGVLNMAGFERRVLFQGVHMLMASELGKPWANDAERESVLVFIGRELPREVFEGGLRKCLAEVDAATT